MKNKFLINSTLLLSLIICGQSFAANECTQWQNALLSCQSRLLAIGDSLNECQVDLTDATDGQLQAEDDLDVCNTKGEELSGQIQELQAENDLLRENQQIPDDMVTALDMVRCVKFLGNQSQKRSASDARIKKMRAQCMKGALKARSLALHLQDAGFNILLVKKLK